MENIIVSEDAIKYFNDNNITSKDWNNFCRKKYNLIDGDIVYFEGNIIGYKKDELKSLKSLK